MGGQRFTLCNKYCRATESEELMISRVLPPSRILNKQVIAMMNENSHDKLTGLSAPQLSLFLILVKCIECNWLHIGYLWISCFIYLIPNCCFILRQLKQTLFYFQTTYWTTSPYRNWPDNSSLKRSTWIFPTFSTFRRLSGSILGSVCVWGGGCLFFWWYHWPLGMTCYLKLDLLLSFQKMLKIMLFWKAIRS